MNKKTLLLLSGLFLGFATSCTRPVSSVEREAPIGVPSVIQDSRVITDSRMALQVTQVNESVVSGDLTRVQVVVQNTSNRPKTINYRFDWYDLDGMLVSTNTPWKTLRIQGQQTSALTATAPNPRAKDFRLNLQRSSQ